MFLYVVRHGAVLGISGGLLTIKYPDRTEDSFPKNTIEGISVFSKATLTTACVEFCLYNNINVGYFSLNGKYYGRLVSVQNTNVPIRIYQVNDSYFDVSRFENASVYTSRIVVV